MLTDINHFCLVNIEIFYYVLLFYWPQGYQDLACQRRRISGCQATAGNNLCLCSQANQDNVLFLVSSLCCNMLMRNLIWVNIFLEYQNTMVTKNVKWNKYRNFILSGNEYSSNVAFWRVKASRDIPIISKKPKEKVVEKEKEKEKEVKSPKQKRLPPADFKVKRLILRC